MVLMLAKSTRHRRTFVTRLLFFVAFFALFVWPGYVINTLFPYSEGYFANKFTRQWFELGPRCMPLTDISENAQDYWQFYGYSYGETLNEKVLSNIVKVTKVQNELLTASHKLVMETSLSEANPLFNKYANYWQSKSKEQGIAYVSGPGYYSLTMLSIKYIRDVLQDDIPIQVFVPQKSNADQKCNKMTMVFSNVECVYFNQHISSENLNKLSSYQYKSLALLLSKFTDTLLLDSDNLPLVKPSLMFSSKEYEEHGMISWPDFWKRSTNYKFYEMANIKNSGPTIMSTPSVESGQIMINKVTHLRTVLLAHYYNVWGPDYFYPLFNQGFPGQGDKDTFYLASRVTGDGSYIMTGVKTQSFGYKDKSGSYHGQGILQKSPDINDEKYWFLHLNEPKLLVDEMIENGFFQPGGLRRAWEIVRFAQKDVSHERAFRSLVGDLELKIWELFYELLKKDFKGFQVFDGIGNDEAADYVQERVRVVSNHV